MKYLSVCSGIEAATVAWKSLDWTPVGFSEIEPFPCEVLKTHYPTIRNYGDMTKYKEWDVEPFDILVGGTPCQSFSVAGLRKGLEDPRGNLTLVFLGMIDHFKPNYVVWENVPGVLSDKTHAFELFLKGLNELGYVFDTDVLDASNFGVPQKRKRVFVLAIKADYINSKIGDSEYERKTDGKLFEISEFGNDEYPLLRKASDKLISIVSSGNFDRETSSKIQSFIKGLQGFFTAGRIESEVDSCTTESCTRENVRLTLYKTHPQDSRITESKDNKADTISRRYGTGGGNVPLVMQEEE